MKRRKKTITIITAFGLFLVLLIWLYHGGSGDGMTCGKHFEVVAHRGVHVNWKKGTYHPVTGCEAQHIYEPTHGYIENTLTSIGAAFDFGATIVEIDIRRTKDNQLVIFHDYMLEGRTNGEGLVSDHPLAYLKTLDIGYGYTHDEGKTFPFRGKGVGLMPTLLEVLAAFPERRYLIDHKDGTMESARILVDIVKELSVEQQKRLYYWGPDKTYDFVRQETPMTRLFCTRQQMKKWFVWYFLTGGLSGFPEECKGLVIGIPPEYTRFVWGWPYKFIRRVHDAGAQFYLMVDREEDAKSYRNLPVDGVVTDYIEVVGGYYK